MRHISILCVGKLKERFYLDAAAEYARRLSRFCRMEITELPEERLPERPSPARIDAALLKEAAAIREKLAKSGVWDAGSAAGGKDGIRRGGTRIAALCIEGRACSSERFAQWMEKSAGNGENRLIFLIGGSFGLHESVKALSDWKLSLSLMTFPHHLARVMLLEQIYRAYQISAGSRYHK